VDGCPLRCYLRAPALGETLLDQLFRDRDLVDLRLDGASIYRDRSRRDGWDWSDENPVEIRFYGRSCQVLQAASGGSRLRAVFGCPAPTPP
jgi:hypothetical protein